MLKSFFRRKNSQSVAAQATIATFQHSQKIIKTEADLIQYVTFTRILAQEINLSSALALHICPLDVASRAIIRPLVEQMRVCFVPLLHRLHWCFTAQC